jgi:small conductance mechanosensitive channel
VINTPDNVHTIIGNNKVFADTIQNYSANPHRRVDLTATISNSVDHRIAIALLKEKLVTVPNVLVSPAPEVDVLEFTAAGPKLCVRPYCRPEHYWDVYFETNRLIREAFTDAGFPAPMPSYAVTTGAAGGSPLAIS